MLSQFDLATFGLNLPGANVHTLPKCNPDAKYNEKNSEYFCIRISIKTGFP